MKLSNAARKIRKALMDEWGIADRAGLFTLDRALEAFDEMRAAQEVLADQGTFIKDRWGQVQLHPAARREKESRAHLLQFLKALDLDLETIANATKAKKRP